ncbi:unnamed protein product [Protopolystoma xenopodis]|uniref:Uncharacterized protein n=1 Tax=Protopolystoma xenopodis TaxID=117903 RepID=A0A448X3B4_9PLAT|nr:unnamed protein product [Protopolystoma xenopodis]
MVRATASAATLANVSSSISSPFASSSPSSQMTGQIIGSPISGLSVPPERELYAVNFQLLSGKYCITYYYILPS